MPRIYHCAFRTVCIVSAAASKDWRATNHRDFVHYPVAEDEHVEPPANAFQPAVEAVRPVGVVPIVGMKLAPHIDKFMGVSIRV